MYRVKLLSDDNSMSKKPHEIIRSDGTVVGKGANLDEANKIMLKLNKLSRIRVSV